MVRQNHSALPVNIGAKYTNSFLILFRRNYIEFRLWLNNNYLQHYHRHPQVGRLNYIHYQNHLLGIHPVGIVYVLNEQL